MTFPGTTLCGVCGHWVPPGGRASWNLTYVLVTCLPTREDRKTCNGPDRVRGLRFLPVPGGVRCRGILWLCPVKGRACSVLGVSSRCFVGRVVFPCALLGLHGCVPVRPGLYGRASGPLPSPDRKARAARRFAAGAAPPSPRSGQGLVWEAMRDIMRRGHAKVGVVPVPAWRSTLVVVSIYVIIRVRARTLTTVYGCLYVYTNVCMLVGVARYTAVWCT